MHYQCICCYKCTWYYFRALWVVIVSNSSATEKLYLEVFTAVLLHAVVGINRTGGGGEERGARLAVTMAMCRTERDRKAV